MYTHKNVFQFIDKKLKIFIYSSPKITVAKKLFKKYY